MPTLLVGVNRGNKATINYLVHGEGPIKILFVMGLASTLDSWQLQVDAFVTERDENGKPIKYDPRYQICVYDNRGIGLSSSPLGRYTTDMMALDAIELLIHLNWKEFHLIGVSMGGMISLKIALQLVDLRYRDKLNTMNISYIPNIISLMLVVTHYGGPYSEQPAEGKKIARKMVFALSEDKRTRKILPLLFSKRFLSDENNYKEAYDGIISSRKIEGGKPPLFGMIGQIHAVNKHVLSLEELYIIRDSLISIMVMTGDEDLLVDPRNSDELNNILNPIEYIKIKETGHAINAERKEEFNLAMFRHVNRGEDIYRTRINNINNINNINIMNNNNITPI